MHVTGFVGGLAEELHKHGAKLIFEQSGHPSHPEQPIRFAGIQHIAVGSQVEKLADKGMVL